MPAGPGGTPDPATILVRAAPAQEAKDAAAFLDASAMPIALVPIGPTQLLGTCQHDLSIFRLSFFGWAPVLRKLSRILLAMYIVCFTACVEELRTTS